VSLLEREGKLGLSQLQNRSILFRVHRLGYKKRCFNNRMGSTELPLVDDDHGSGVN